MVTGSSLTGRLCGLLSSSGRSLISRFTCLTSACDRLAAFELHQGCSLSTAGVSLFGALRLLASTSDPQSGGPRIDIPDTREAWRPNQGLSMLAVEAAFPATTSLSGDISIASSESEAGVDTAGGKVTSGDTARPVTEMDEVFNILEEMGLQPGRHCVVGDGLAEVEVGLYLNGVKVALDMEARRPLHAMASDAKSYALRRAARSMLQAHGWHPVTLVATDWHQLDGEQKASYLAHCINHALGHGNHEHSHEHQQGQGSCGTGCGGSRCGNSNGHKH
ncbi:hypothetical protein Vretimale_13776 [Volvox reticuliferus]|uniref:RAP domain-containing protein n=2 Tax=Volvox reticuliferus TaxID=1737510 RepID=A0A8J4FVS9_9CHLO|nr:hypothetical protein Vretifemale_14617 [Volvox reticuliferus]GIM09978.1 hypothetical protein Vretimale_13776 [Volvox reticuliferus]